MNVFSFGSHGYRISLHVGSGGVSGVCLKQEKDGAVSIVYNHRSDVPIRERVQAKTLELHTGEAIERVLKNIHEHVKAHIAHVDVVYTSPWFSTHTKTILVEHKEPFIVTKKLISDVSKKEIEKVKQQAPEQDIILEQKITHIRLNGYESNNPIGKKVTQCELSLFASFASKEFVEKTKSAIQKILSPHSIALHSFPFVSFSVISHVWRDDQYFVYIDVGAEVTEVVCGTHGALSESFSFPVGTNHLVRAIAQKREIPHELALSLLSLYSHGAADSATSSALETIVKSLQEEWKTYIEQIIRDTGSDHAVVQKMYISADPVALSLWSKTLQAHSPRTIILTPDMFAQFVHVPPQLRVDTLSLLESIFINAQTSTYLQ